MVRFAVILHNLLGGHLYEYVCTFLGSTNIQLIRSPGFNRLAARTHSRVQRIKAQWAGTEEELQQLKEQEKLLKESEDKIKELTEETNGPA